MEQKAAFRHAGCPVCVSAEQSVLGARDRSRFDVDVAHLGTSKGRVAQAEQLGVKSIPARALVVQLTCAPRDVRRARRARSGRFVVGR